MIIWNRDHARKAKKHWASRNEKKPLWPRYLIENPLLILHWALGKRKFTGRILRWYFDRSWKTDNSHRGIWLCVDCLSALELDFCPESLYNDYWVCNACQEEKDGAK